MSNSLNGILTAELIVVGLQDGTKEEGKYKNNVLITSQKKKHLFLIRSAKFRERIEAAVSAAQRASKIALQKADIAISRTSTARGKAELADVAAVHAVKTPISLSSLPNNWRPTSNQVKKRQISATPFTFSFC